MAKLQTQIKSIIEATVFIKTDLNTYDYKAKLATVTVAGRQLLPGEIENAVPTTKIMAARHQANLIKQAWKADQRKAIFDDIKFGGQGRRKTTQNAFIGLVKHARTIDHVDIEPLPDGQGCIICLADGVDTSNA